MNLVDPSGEIGHVALGAVIGGVAGFVYGGLSGGWKGAFKGALAGLAGGAVAAVTLNPALVVATWSGVGTCVVGFGVAGSVSGALSGLAGGVVSETFDLIDPCADANWQEVWDAAKSGAFLGVYLEGLVALQVVLSMRLQNAFGEV